MPSSWDTPATVEGFVRSPANQALLRYAARCRRDADAPTCVVDIGCGAGRNALPLARAGFDVTGIDTSWPMLHAAADRGFGHRLNLALATMDSLPVRSRSAELVIAHGIWNLARSGGEFRQALREAARIARPGAGLFVFTFSRSTLPADAPPVEGETFVYTQFSGQPQVFLTRDQLIDELHTAGFTGDPAMPLCELNLPPPGQRRIGGPPVIFEGAFTRATEDP
jgi:SAM-dependent methyltransferase